MPRRLKSRSRLKLPRRPGVKRQKPSQKAPKPRPMPRLTRQNRKLRPRLSQRPRKKKKPIMRRAPRHRMKYQTFRSLRAALTTTHARSANASVRPPKPKRPGVTDYADQFGYRRSEEHTSE